MPKATIFLKRAPNLTQAEFAAWWLNEHRRLAERLPGLQRHSFTLLDGIPFDAIVQQWFSTPEALACCYDTDTGKAVVQDSLVHTSMRIRVVAEEHVFEVGGLTFDT